MTTQNTLYDEALDSYQKALEIYKSYGDRSNEARILTKIGDLHLAKGEDILRGIPNPPPPPPPSPFSSALESYQQALQAYQDSSDHIGEASVWLKIGDTYMSAIMNVNREG